MAGAADAPESSGARKFSLRPLRLRNNSQSTMNAILPLFVRWDVNPTMISIGSFEIRYYGLMWALALGISAYIFSRIIKREGYPDKLFDSIFWYGVLSTIIGARLGHCLFYDPGYYLTHPVEILYIHQGGLASHGAAVGLLVGLWLFSRKNKMPYIWSLDRIAIAVGIAGALEMGSISVVSVILEPIIEIVISLVLGALSGLALNWLETYFHSRSKRLSLTVAFVLLMVGISSMEFELGGVKIGFSLLLVCMMTGTVFCNVCSASEELMSRLDRWTGPINILFFVLSGAELDLNILSNPLVLLIGIIYIVFRSLGKISGSYISCAMTKCSDHIKKHLGITLLPQAGVALGMALTATSLADGSIVRNVVLFSVLVYELIGPSLTKRSLLAAGEIKPEGKTSAREENKPVKPITLK